MNQPKKPSTTTLFYLFFMMLPIVLGFILGYLVSVEYSGISIWTPALVFACGAMIAWIMTTIHWLNRKADMLQPTSRWLMVAALCQTPCTVSYMIAILMIVHPTLF